MKNKLFHITGFLIYYDKRDEKVVMPVDETVKAKDEKQAETKIWKKYLKQIKIEEKIRFPEVLTHELEITPIQLSLPFKES